MHESTDMNCQTEMAIGLQRESVSGSGKFREWWHCLVSTVTPLPSPQLDFAALISHRKKWMEDAQ